MEEVMIDARRALANGQQTAAASLLKQVVRTNPTNGEAWYLLGQALSEPAQKADCAQRAASLGYTPDAERAEVTSAASIYDVSPQTDATRPFDSPAASSTSEPAPPTAPNATDPPRFHSDLSPSEGWSSRTPNIAGGALGAPSLPSGAGGYAYVMPPTAGSLQTTHYAGFWVRFAAAFVDGIILYIPNLGIQAVIRSLIQQPLTARSAVPPINIILFTATISLLVQFVISWLYFAGFESSPRQATPGKMLLRLKVTDLQGGRISFARATAREWSKIISAFILLIGYIMAAFTARKQALHDLIAGTLVLRNS